MVGGGAFLLFWKKYDDGECRLTLSIGDINHVALGGAGGGGHPSQVQMLSSSSSPGGARVMRGAGLVRLLTSPCWA